MRVVVEEICKCEDGDCRNEEVSFRSHCWSISPMRGDQDKT